MSNKAFAEIMVNLLQKQGELIQQSIAAFKEVSKDKDGGTSSSSAGAAKAKKLKKKLQTDPNKPKRSPSGYHLFMSVHTSAFKEEHPDKNQTEILAVVAKKWRESNDEEKDIYMKQAAVLKGEFEAKLQMYNDGMKSNSADSASPATTDPTDPQASSSSDSMIKSELLTASTGEVMQKAAEIMKKRPGEDIVQPSAKQAKTNDLNGSM